MNNEIWISLITHQITSLHITFSSCTQINNILNVNSYVVSMNVVKVYLYCFRIWIVFIYVHYAHLVNINKIMQTANKTTTHNHTNMWYKNVVSICNTKDYYYMIQICIHKYTSVCHIKYQYVILKCDRYI